MSGGAHIMSGGGAGRVALGGGNRSMSGGTGHFRSMSVDSGHFKNSGNAHFKSGSGPRNFSKRDSKWSERQRSRQVRGKQLEERKIRA